MNNNKLEKFIENIESIKMTQNEKNEMRQHLASFAVNYAPIKSPYSSALLLTKKIMATAFIAVISIGSFSQFASSDALPGDTLYPVKIAHERIKLATTNGETRKINFEIRQTEKRIQEATQLAQKEKLNPENEKEIAKVIKELTTRVKNHIEEVKQENPQSALILNSELKSTIRANSEILRKVTNQNKKENKAPKEILEGNKKEIIKPETVKEVTQETENTNEETIVEIELTEKSATITENEDQIETEQLSSTNTASTELDIPDVDNNTVEIELKDSNTDNDVEPKNTETETDTTLSLLESLDEEVEEIEALEIEVENEIIKDELLEDEQPTDISENLTEIDSLDISLEEPIETIISDDDLITVEEINNGSEIEIISENDILDEETININNSTEINEEIIEDKIEISEVKEIKEVLNDEIKSLQDIIEIKEKILEMKSLVGTHIHETEIEDLEGVSLFNEELIEETAEKFIQEEKYKQAFIQFQNILEHYQEEKIELNAEKKLGIENQISISTEVKKEDSEEKTTDTKV